MGKRHLKRISAPKTWKIKRKGITFTTRPHPGTHKLEEGLSLNVILRDLIKIGNSAKQIKGIMDKKEVLVDGKRRKELKFMVGLMDVITIPEIKQNHRIVYTNKGKITIKEIDAKEAKLKVCKIVNKTTIKQGKSQITLSDGRNKIVDNKEYKIGDSLLITVPEQEIKQHFKLEQGAYILLTGGSSIGKTGVLTSVEGNKIKFKKDKEEVETLKKYAFIVGKDKAAITIE